MAVLDYGAGNLRSVVRALRLAGADPEITDAAATAEAADVLVVPGVGHFGQCATQLVAAGFTDLLHRWVADGRPVVGICVGMQILYATSEEAPGVAGLGLLPGRVRRLPDDVVVPHMGWDVVRAVTDDPVAAGIDGQRCYFANSYYAEPADDAHVLAVCDYGPGFPCVVRTGSVLGVQFHPEKSAHVGARLLADVVRSVDRQARTTAAGLAQTLRARTPHA